MSAEEPRPNDKRLLAAAGCLLLLALPLVGAGPVNGDAAVYLYQAREGIFDERTIHIGYIALAALLRPLAGSALGAVMDGISCLALAGLALAAGLLARRQGGRGLVALLVTAACALPVAPFAEVDLLWAALLALAAALPQRWAAALLVAGALSVSPVALLGLPWVAWTRRDPWGPGAGLLAWLPLLAWCGSDWWLGPRGVLTAVAVPSSWMRLCTAWGAALLLPGIAGLVLVGLQGLDRARALGAALAMVPFFLLVRNADVHAWLLGVLWLGLAAGQGALRWPVGRLLLWLPLVLQLGFSWRSAALERNRIRQDEALAARLAQRADGEKVVSHSWTWGVRYGLQRGGRPYGDWCSPGELDPAAQRILVLPPGTTIPGDWSWHVGQDGVLRGVKNPG